MENFNQLVPKLKTLRRSGVLETLELRNREAIGEKCTYVEFLQRLVEDEVERRGQKQLSLRLRRSGLNVQKTLESFDFAFNTTINRQEIYDLATCSFVEQADKARVRVFRPLDSSERFVLRIGMLTHQEAVNLLVDFAEAYGMVLLKDIDEEQKDHLVRTLVESTSELLTRLTGETAREADIEEVLPL